MDCTVFVNGKRAGEWKYGYSTFEVDITDYLNGGDNLITVRVDYREPNSRWYSGAGIYRKVWLKISPECRLISDGVYISADINGSVTVTAETDDTSLWMFHKDFRYHISASREEYPHFSSQDCRNIQFLWYFLKIPIYRKAVFSHSY